MTQIYLQNTLSGKKEEFKPLRAGYVGMYNCGPTVYNYPHIGNLRAYIFADTLKRLMKVSGYKVQQVINITDVGHLVNDADVGEDKMEKARKREHKSAWDIAKFYTNVFFENLRDLNVDVEGTQFPHATDFIKEQIAIVSLLEKKGFTYKTSDGIYFDTSKFSDYGKLGKINIGGLREGERIGVNDEKKNLSDFALWKFSPVVAEGAIAEKREMEWQSPWGVGFPGWHIECSAMSETLLGQPFDIHTGGIDHIPVHHNNEIAQSEGAHGKTLANYWVHSAFLNIDGGKMAKSEDNFLTLDVLKKRGIDPMAYRYFLLGARYSTPMNFSWDALEAGATAYKRLKASMVEMVSGGKAQKDLVEKALGFVADDLDTPKALALCWDILKDEKIAPADKKATLVEIDRLLGLGLGLEKKSADKFEKELPAEVLVLVEARKLARDNKDWKKADELRDKIIALGHEVKDTAK